MSTKTKASEARTLTELSGEELAELSRDTRRRQLEGSRRVTRRQAEARLEAMHATVKTRAREALGEALHRIRTSADPTPLDADAVAMIALAYNRDPFAVLWDEVSESGLFTDEADETDALRALERDIEIEVTRRASVQEASGPHTQRLHDLEQRAATQYEIVGEKGAAA